MELKQIRHMMQLQDAMNSKINPEWRTAGYNYLRAAWVEAGELMDHYGYKWWKKQEVNMPQVQMELVDIWHFLLSDALRDQVTAVGIQELYKDSFDLQDYWETEHADEYEVRTVLETFVFFMLQSQMSERTPEEYPITAFFVLCRLLDLDSNSLYLKYIGKNVLNFFRQDNGYKTGTYIKIWNGREDNEHLEDILNSVAKDEEDVQSYIYDQLALVYSKVETE